MTQFNFHSTSEEVAAALSSHIKSCTVIVTGVSPGGLGLETARAIALQSPKLVILAGRSLSKVQEAENIVNKAAPHTPTRRLVLDLASLAKVRLAAEELNNSTDIQSIDVVINNAGIMARPYELTEDGIESQFGTNHIGHFLFTQLIMPKILAAGKNARIVNVSSNAYKGGGVRFGDWNFDNGKVYDPWTAYGQSKTANILYSKALAQRYESKGLHAYSVHPGAIFTNLGHHAIDDLKKLGYVGSDGKPINNLLTWKTPGEGSSTSIVAAFDPFIADQNGAYLEDCNIGQTPEDFVMDPDAPEKLWMLSEKLVGQVFACS